MVSEFAMSEIRSHERMGFAFSHEEVIRLNALGLEVDHGAEAASDYALPRVAFLAGLTLREPTIAHEMWMDRVAQVSEFDDAASMVAVHAFALTRDADELPPVDAGFRISAAVEWFAASKLRKVTIRQLVSALEYVRYGCDQVSCEYPADAQGKGAAKERREIGSVAVGVMREALAVGIGLSLADLRSLTVAEAYGITRKAIEAKGAEGSEKSRIARANDRFYKTLDEMVDKKKGK